jgi:hypothetical protein
MLEISNYWLPILDMTSVSEKACFEYVHHDRPEVKAIRFLEELGKHHQKACFI